MSRRRRLPLVHPLAEVFFAAIESVTTSMSGSTKGRYRTTMEYFLRHSVLQNSRSRRTCGCMFRMRTSGHLFQLMPQPALPKVPGECPRPLARSAGKGAAAHPLRPRGFHIAAAAFAACAAEQTRGLCLAVPGQCRIAEGNWAK
jgi:hypothetical protein